MKKAKTYEIFDNFFKLDQRLNKIENLVLINEYRNDLLLAEKCRSTYSKSELAILFYVLMDEGILFFDSSDAKKK